MNLKNSFTHEELDELSVFIKAMAHPTRLWILQFLAQQQCCYSGEIADELPIARSTISEHLRQLKEAGLIQGEIDHPKIKYCINPENWHKTRQMLESLFLIKIVDLKKTKCHI
jgi:ArsR family transcriptional regulator, arsenate/arsenite/antimonite-responsive transcriptional repressor